MVFAPFRATASIPQDQVHKFIEIPQSWTKNTVENYQPKVLKACWVSTSIFGPLLKPRGPNSSSHSSHVLEIWVDGFCSWRATDVGVASLSLEWVQSRSDITYPAQVDVLQIVMGWWRIVFDIPTLYHQFPPNMEPFTSLWSESLSNRSFLVFVWTLPVEMSASSQ